MGKSIRKTTTAVLFLLMLCCLLTGRRAEAAVQIKGIDVSRYQGVIDWKAVKADGIDFTMIGVGYVINGTASADPKFTYNIQNALANNVKVGVYIYSHALTVEEAEREADFVLKQIKGYKISYPIAFDIEDSSQTHLTNAKRTDITIAFLKKIEAAGYYPMIYASEYWFNYQMDLSRLTRYDKWVARWASSVSFQPLSIWQYSCKGVVKGISGDVDLDYDYRDYSKIITPRTTPIASSEAVSDNTTENNTTTDTLVQTGWVKTNGKYYYYKSNGEKATGWLKESGQTYYLDANGARKYGWLKIGSKKFFLNLKSGKLRKGWMKYKGKTYYFSTQNGQMRKGWLTFGTKKYYIDKNGYRVSGWQKIKGNWYYFNKTNGVMKRNCKVGRYVFEADGVCKNYRS